MKVQSYNHNSVFLSSTARNDSCGEDHWAVILGGTTYQPRRGLARASFRRQRPQHFCRTPGSDFLINQTRKQTALLFPPEKTLFVVTRDHLSYCDEVLPDVPPKNLIVQPQDDGSVFAVLYAALRLAKTNPSAILTFFPADFAIADAENFMAQVKSAAAAVRSHRNLTLLGTRAEAPETDKQWIELDAARPLDETFNVWRVRRFLHRPSADEARELWRRGALWNSPVMVGTAATFLRKIRRAVPEIYARFGEARSKIGTPGEARAIEKAFYSNYVDTDFARDVLAKSADQLAVVPVPDAKPSAVHIKRTVSRAAPERITESAQNYMVARAGF
jgi:mannose-1-phosphate guanylyltransferase